MDGKPVTGWRGIGDKWYYFDENGVMAVNTKIDGNEIVQAERGKKNRNILENTIRRRKRRLDAGEGFQIGDCRLLSVYTFLYPVVIPV